MQKDFDLGPSLLDELEPVILSLGSTSPPPPPSPLDETTNVRNELKEMATKVSGKKKQAMVSTKFLHFDDSVITYFI